MSEALALLQEQRPEAFVVAARVRARDSASVVRSTSVLQSGCLRVIVGSQSELEKAVQSGDTPDIIVPREEALTGLARMLHGALDARSPQTRTGEIAAARQKARRIVVAISRGGHEDISHCERLAEWSRELAGALELTPSRVVDVELGALLHDIGNLYIRDEVLNRPGPLTRPELAHLQRHPLIGAELLRDIPELHCAIPIVLCHHERPDGTGYPRGLVRQAIPFDARVFQVVDTYESLVVGRPWRPAVDHAAAVAHMRERIGAQFDETVFAAFEKVSPAWDSGRRAAATVAPAA